MSASIVRFFKLSYENFDKFSSESSKKTTSFSYQHSSKEQRKETKFCTTYAIMHKLILNRITTQTHQNKTGIKQ